MRAVAGDHIVVHSMHLDEPARDGEVIAVRGADGGPPYVVRWSGTGHESLFFPGAGTTVHGREAAPPAPTGGGGTAR